MVGQLRRGGAPACASLARHSIATERPVDRPVPVRARWRRSETLYPPGALGRLECVHITACVEPPRRLARARLAGGPLPAVRAQRSCAAHYGSPATDWRHLQVYTYLCRHQVVDVTRSPVVSLARPSGFELRFVSYAPGYACLIYPGHIPRHHLRGPLAPLRSVSWAWARLKQGPCETGLAATTPRAIRLRGGSL